MSTLLSAPPGPMANGANGHGHGHGPLQNYLAHPLQFGSPVEKSGQDLEGCTRVVVAGPASPGPFRRTLPDVEGMANGSTRKDVTEGRGEASTSTSRPSPTVRTPKTSLDSPSTSRKGNEQVNTPSKATQPKARKEELDVSWPVALAMTKKPAAGLYNPSMACYANATLQVLLHTPPVLQIAQDHNPRECLQASRKGFCMLCALREMAFGDHWSGRVKAYRAGVLADLGSIKKGFSKNRQEDTHEFFRFVTDGLVASALASSPKDVSEKIKHSTWVHRTWGGLVRSRVVCSRCNKPSDTFDHFLDLSVDVNKDGKKNLEAMLQGFVKEDKLEGQNKYHCENCKAKAIATKSFKIFEAPPILTIHFKRFEMSFGYGGRARAEKFNGYIDYPEWLDISPFMVNKDQGHYYRLFGVTCHRGTELRFGHYTSYVRHPSGQWYHADDEDMSKCSSTDAMRDRNAYLISYIRVTETEYKTRTVSTPSRPSQTVKSSAVRSEHGSPVKAGPTANGSAIKNGHVIGSPMKRKREDDNEDSPHASKASRFDSTNAIPPSTPRETPPSSPPRTTPLSAVRQTPPKFTYSRSNGHPKFQPKSSSDMYHPKPMNPDDRLDSPIQRPRNPSPDDSPSADGLERLSKKQRKKLNKKMRREEGGAGRGAPMPFAQGRSSGAGSGVARGTVGFRGTFGKPGMMKNLKPRPRGI